MVFKIFCCCRFIVHQIKNSKNIIIRELSANIIFMPDPGNSMHLPPLNSSVEYLPWGQAVHLSEANLQVLHSAEHLVQAEAEFGFSLESNQPAAQVRQPSALETAKLPEPEVA